VQEVKKVLKFGLLIFVFNF